MSLLESSLYTLGALDKLAAQRTCIHSLDPRGKVLLTLTFAAVVMSFPPYTVSALLPLSVFPVVMGSLGNIPARTIGVRLVWAAPFVLFMGVWNPFIDTAPLIYIGDVPVSGGWLSFTSILLRFILTVSAVIILVGTTGFNPLCAALPHMGLPHVFAAQLLFLYRYIFVLMHEGARMHRARQLRSCGETALRLHSYAALLGQLLLRTMDRAQRIHNAMLCRGFDGSIPLPRPLRFTRQDAANILFWLIFFSLARCVDIPHLLGRVTTLGLDGISL